MHGIKLRHFSNGHGRLRIVAQNDQGIFLTRVQRQDGREQDARVSAPGDDHFFLGHLGFRQNDAGRKQVHPAKLFHFVQDKRLGQGVHPHVGHRMHLTERFHGQSALPDENGASGGPPFGAGKRDRLGPGGDVRRNAELAFNDAGVVCYQSHVVPL